MARAPRRASRPWWAVVAALTLAVLSVAAAVLVWRTPDAARAERQEERHALASAVADARRPWFTEARAQAESVATAVAATVTPGRQLGDAIGAPQLAALAAAATRLDDGVFLVDHAGRVVATVPRKAALVGQTRTGAPISAALKGSTSVSGVVVDPLERRPVVRVAAPVTVGGRTLGAVVGDSRVRDGSVGRALGPTAPVGNVRVSLVTPDLQTLGPAGATEPASRDVLPAAQALRRGQATVEYAGEGGVRRAAAAAVISDRWAVVVDSDASVLDRSGPRPITAVAAVALAGACGVAAVVASAARVARIRAQADAAQRTMLSVTGHELRTPLTVIVGQSRTLARRWDALSPTQRRDLVTGIGHQARTLERLVERLLHAAELAARVGRGLQQQPVDLASVAAEAVATTSALSPLHDIRLTAERPSVVLGDAGALRQVLGHLLDNAVRYSPDGGVVEVTVASHAKRAEVSVTDEGVGLPADRERIFEGFVQGEEVDVRVHDEGGVGLGLTIVRDLVTQMGGSVRAEDHLPRGARFVVELPIRRPE